MIQTIMTERLPLWLQSLDPSTITPSPVGAGDWPPGLPRLSPTEIASIHRQDMLDTFEALFDPAIDALSGGTSITKFLSMDHRQPHPGRFMRWIKADPSRYKQYLDARDIAAELISNDIVGIADGTDNPLEDVARSKLRVDARKLVMGFDAKERFTTTTKIDVSSHQTIDITAAMAPALARAQEMQRLARERMASLPSQLVQDVGFRVVSDENLLETPDNASEEDD